MLKGQAKRDYQREYMKRKRGLTKGSNIGLIAGSNKGSNLFSVDLLDPSLYDIPIGVTPKGIPKGPRGLRPAPKPAPNIPGLVIKGNRDKKKPLHKRPTPKWLEAPKVSKTVTFEELKKRYDVRSKPLKERPLYKRPMPRWLEKEGGT